MHLWSSARGGRRTALWLAALAALVLGFGVSASRAPAPRVSDDPDASEVQGTAGPVGSDETTSREAWFYEQRAYPGDLTPQAALVHSREQAASLPRRAPGSTRVGPVGTLILPGLSWTSLGPHPITYVDQGWWNGRSPVDGKITAIALPAGSTTTAYVGTPAGGVWKTTDAGVHWTPIFDTQISSAIGAITVDPNDPSTVYVGTGEATFVGDTYFGDGVYRSTDAGSTWTKIGGTRFDNCYISDVAVLPTDSSTIMVAAGNAGRYYTSCTPGLYRSTDGGAHWTTRTPPWPTNLAGDPENPAVWYAATKANGLYKSTDSGVTWTKLAGGLPTSGMRRGAVAVAPTDSSRVYAAFGRDGSRDLIGIYSSSDGGQTWSNLGAPSDFCGTQCDYDLVLTVSPTDPGTLYAGGVALYRHDNGGWSQFGTHATVDSNGIHSDQHAIVFDSAGHIWVGSDGGIYRLTTAGVITDLNADLSITQVESGMAGTLGTKLLAGLQDNGTVAYSGSGWTMVANGDGGDAAVDPNNSNIVYHTIQWGHLFKSTNGGAGWGPEISPSGFDWSRTAFYPPFVMHPADASRLYMGDYQLWRSLDGGSSWQAISGDLSRGGGGPWHVISALGLSPSSTSTVYVGSSDGVVHSTTNDGATWRKATGIPNRWVMDIYVDPVNANIAYVAVSGFGTGHIFKTVNGGTSWTNISGNLPDTPTNAVVVDDRFTPGTIYIGTDIGVSSPTAARRGTRTRRGCRTPSSWSCWSTRDVESRRRDARPRRLGRAVADAATAPGHRRPRAGERPGRNGRAHRRRESVRSHGGELQRQGGILLRRLRRRTDGDCPFGRQDGPRVGGNARRNDDEPRPVPGHDRTGDHVVHAREGRRRDEGDSHGRRVHGRIGGDVQRHGRTELHRGLALTDNSRRRGRYDDRSDQRHHPGRNRSERAQLGADPGDRLVHAIHRSRHDDRDATGHGFTGTTAVRIAGKAESFTVDSDTEVSLVVGAGTRSGKVTLAAPGGTATSATAFTMVAISAFSPPKGHVGTKVTIIGTGLSGATAVKFNGTDAQGFTVVSATRITATVAAGTTTGAIIVVTPDGTAVSGASWVLAP